MWFGAMTGLSGFAPATNQLLPSLSPFPFPLRASGLHSWANGLLQLRRGPYDPTPSHCPSFLHSSHLSLIETTTKTPLLACFCYDLLVWFVVRQQGLRLGLNHAKHQRPNIANTDNAILVCYRPTPYGYKGDHPSTVFLKHGKLSLHRASCVGPVARRTTLGAIVRRPSKKRSYNPTWTTCAHPIMANHHHSHPSHPSPPMQMQMQMHHGPPGPPGPPPGPPASLAQARQTLLQMNEQVWIQLGMRPFMVVGENGH
jgi:hypothetical protein